MQTLDTVVSIEDHKLVLQDAALPRRAERARVIVIWEPAKQEGRRSPPPALAGLGEERGDILDSAPESDWDSLR